jgi:hypothetical protein
MSVGKTILAFLGWSLLLLVPMFTTYTGAAMNEAVVWANGGQMPVSAYACEERMAAKNAPQAVDDENIFNIFHQPKAQAPKDYVHKCADKDTRLRWLDDWMLGDDGISSLGDLLQGSSDTLNYIVYPIWGVGIIAFIIDRKRKQ